MRRLFIIFALTLVSPAMKVLAGSDPTSADSPAEATAVTSGADPESIVSGTVSDATESAVDIIVDMASASADPVTGSPIPSDSVPGLVLFNGQPNIYDMPYSLTANYPNYKRLAGNTAVLVAGGITALVVLELLPENSTNWDRSSIKSVPFFQRYYNNVIHGPHWDGDDFIFNYVLHPYAGAAYFMSARSQGFSFWYSALYSFCISTFFWEYGVEAFMERPSIQDLIITPVVGSVIGELFYKAKRQIVHNDYKLLGWKPLGYVAAFLLDPVNEALGWFRGNNAHGYAARHAASYSRTEVSLTPTLTSTAGSGFAPGFNLSITF